MKNTANPYQNPNPPSSKEAIKQDREIRYVYIFGFCTVEEEVEKVDVLRISHHSPFTITNSKENQSCALYNKKN